MTDRYKRGGPVPGMFTEGSGFMSGREPRIANAAYQRGREEALREIDDAADRFGSFHASRALDESGWMIVKQPGDSDWPMRTFTEALFAAIPQPETEGEG